jgi:sulfite reductase (NADPH) flavoprotein alpha-component
MNDQKKNGQSKTGNQDIINQLQGLEKEQLIWLAGYFKGQSQYADQLSNTIAHVAGLPQGRINFETILQSDTLAQEVLQSAGNAHITPESTPSQPQKEITIMYGSHSGNGKGIAKEALEIANERGYNAKLVDMAKFRARDIKNIKNLLLIVSTHGEGDPPSAAEELYEYILSKKAPKLDALNYTILALGDKSYVHYCKVGVDFDEKFKLLGANSFLTRVDCDVDYDEDAEKWLEDSFAKLDELYGASVYQGSGDAQVKVSPIKKKKKYTQNHPFQAEVLAKVNLNGKGSPKGNISC